MSHKVPVCGFAPFAAGKNQQNKTRHLDEEEEEAPSSGGGDVCQLLQKKFNCNRKPLSEWTKLDAKAKGDKVWTPIKGKKCETVCACNPQLLNNMQRIAEQVNLLFASLLFQVAEDK